MIDVHSHLIYGVDDGSPNIEQSIKMVEKAAHLGISTIIATPHYHEYVYDTSRVEEHYQELLHRISGYDVSIKLGYEVFINPLATNLIKNKKRLTLAKTNRMLFEFPFNAKPASCYEAIKRLQLENVVPVIAHPERNREFINNLGYLVNFIRMGAMIQVDAASIAGVYGVRIKEFVKKMIKMNLVDMVASNAHYASDYTNWYMEAYKNVAQWAGQDCAHKVFYQNAKRMLDGIDENMFRVIS